MYSRKQFRRLRRYLIVVTAALVLNIIVPTTAQAQTVSPSDSTGNSHSVLVQNQPTEKPTSSLTNLPEPTARPMIVKTTMVIRASAYSSTVDQCDGDPFTTASGTKVRDGIVAMNGLPFGTKIRIPSHYGDKIFTVTDRMNAKWGNKRIDIWMPTRNDAKQWGVRTVTVEIVT
jgi:3D (Asp-Asp-Asp) domain-containing protein